MNDAICCAITQSTARPAITFADRPVLGHGEVADSPIAVPNVSRTNDKRRCDERAGEDCAPFDEGRFGRNGR